jgi:aryl-alcohol dehydrogenase-like predicted oxidoreductase
MEKRRLGKTGLEVSVLGFGGAEIGFGGASREVVEELLNRALDAGLNVIDTAECYEVSEERIGESVSHRRNEFHLFSKCGHSRGYDNPDWNDISLLEASLDRSLKRLRTDHLDLFQLHSCPHDVLKKGDVIAFMQRAKAAGKTRFIGYSGENDAAEYAIRSGAFDTLQISINIADQACIDTILPQAAEAGMGLIAKRPIANAAWKQHNRPEGYTANYWERLQKLAYDFLPTTDAVEIALRFTLSVPGVSMALVGTAQPGRYEENAAIAAKGPLDAGRFTSIRMRWKEAADPAWRGEI